jgi:hypothetical protein
MHKQTCTHPDHHSRVIFPIPSSQARQVVTLGRLATQHVLDLIKRFGIECALEHNGIVFAACTPSQVLHFLHHGFSTLSLPKLRKAHKMQMAAEVLGVPGTELWSIEECNRRLGASFLGAYYDPLVGTPCLPSPVLHAAICSLLCAHHLSISDFVPTGM